MLTFLNKLSSTPQYTMPPEFGGKQGTEVFQRERTVLILGSQIPSAGQPTGSLCAGYSVKLSKIYI